MCLVPRIKNDVGSAIRHGHLLPTRILRSNIHGGLEKVRANLFFPALEKETIYFTYWWKQIRCQNWSKREWIILTGGDILTIAFWSIYKMIVLRNELAKMKNCGICFWKKLRYIWKLISFLSKCGGGGGSYIGYLMTWICIYLNIFYLCMKMIVSFIVDMIELFLREINTSKGEREKKSSGGILSFWAASWKW